jgi:hypothetical protein
MAASWRKDCMAIVSKLCIYFRVSHATHDFDRDIFEYGSFGIRNWYNDIHIILDVQNRSVNLFFLIRKGMG